MRQANKTTLIFLGACLGFAETTLGILANTTNANPTLVAAFAVIALGMVLAALVLMYWREPAFLTFSTVTFLKNLKWRKRQSDFSVDEHKVLLSLSNKDWEWRTFGSLEASTGLSRDKLGSVLKGLMLMGLVTGSVSRYGWKPIFGLVERVGPGRIAKRLEREKQTSGV